MVHGISDTVLEGVEKMEMNELTPHVEELKRVLEGKADEGQILSELNTYLNVYHVSLEAAKRGIIRKYGGDVGFVTAGSMKKKISELKGNENSVDITAVAIFVEKKDIQVKGVPKTILSGILGDETGTGSFTVWDVNDIVMEKGSVYTLKNVYTKLWNDKIQINLGNRGVVEKSDEQIDLPERTIAYTSTETKICDLREGIGNVTVTGKIVSIETKNIQSQNESKTVFSGMLADDTGKIQFSAWKDFELKNGETIRVENAYIKGWRGIPQLNLGERADVSRVDDTFEISDSATNSKTVAEILRIGGGLDVSVSGTAIDLRTGSGLIKRCPECNRSVLSDECVAHGRITPIPDIRMKLVIDDGTGAINAIVGREDTERITGIRLEDAVAKAKEMGDHDCVARMIEERILIKDVTVTGNVMSDEYGPMMIVRNIVLNDADLTAKAEKLLDIVEGSL